MVFEQRVNIAYTFSVCHKTSITKPVRTSEINIKAHIIPLQLVL